MEWILRARRRRFIGHSHRSGRPTIFVGLAWLADAPLRFSSKRRACERQPDRDQWREINLAQAARRRTTRTCGFVRAGDQNRTGIMSLEGSGSNH